jgi:magnesium chelatase subunit D
MTYPFTAIVAQEKLKKALLLCAINPAIGGLLIQGDKGTAKSTAARAVAAVVPQVTKMADCVFNCDIDLPAAICEVCNHPEKTVVQQRAPFVNLPIGATEERILGSLDLEAVLVQKKKKFQPGLLASVHQGILYIDEVNLLPDHLVDLLLDVSAMGENRIEREGLSITHPSRFTLVGTMNPEEGQLRPQFLDRFALMVHVDAPSDIEERTEVVRRRIAFENDRLAFFRQWENAEAQLQQRLISARALLPLVTLSDHLLSLISQLCIAVNVKSLRADIVIYKTAVTLAALDQRKEVTEPDIREAAELALAHRSKNKPQQAAQQSSKKDQSKQEPQQPTQPEKNTREAPEQPQTPEQADWQPEKKNSTQQTSFENAEEDNQQGENEKTNAPSQQPDQHRPTEDQSTEDIPDEMFEATAGALPRLQDLIGDKTDSLLTGKRSLSDNTNRGAYIRPMPVTQHSDIAVDATVIQALMRNPEELDITIADLRQKKRAGKTGNLIVFVVDASGSMAARKRMEAVKGTVLNLLTEAYEKRDTVAVISFRGVEAQVMLQATQSTAMAEEAMRLLPTGGRTPLPHALNLAIELLQTFGSGLKTRRPVVVLLTDGKANVSLPGTSSDPWEQTVQLCADIKAMQIQSLVLDSGSDYFNLNKAAELAALMGGRYQTLSNLSDTELIPIINQITQ